MIFLQLIQQLTSLGHLLSMITDQQYNYKIVHLRNASIGGHTRHIIELLQCATKGHRDGKVDYVNRKRNGLLETDRFFAMDEIHTLILQIEKPDAILRLITDDMNEVSPGVSTTYFREVVYNTEHAVHHLALMRVGLIEMGLNIVNEDFGVANATIRYMHSIKENK